MSGKDYLAEVKQDFAHDPTKESKGVWMTYKRFEFRIARAHRNNVAFAKVFEERMRPYQWSIDRGNFGALKEVAQAILMEVYAETILTGIRRLGSTEELPYTKEDGITLFKGSADIWDEVYKFAGAEANYTADAAYAPAQVQADSGN